MTEEASGSANRPSISSPKKAIAVICPVYNEQESIRYFYDRFSKVRDQLSNELVFDLIFVNNASTDRTLERIQELQRIDPSVQIITHSRNFGYQASVVCGLTHASADAYVVIDVDCEDPPEMIATFVEKWREGYDLVYGLRETRPENRVLILARKLFYRLTHRIADWEFIIDMAEFSLFTDRVRQQVLSHRSTFPFVRSDLAYAGFRRYPLPYSRERRNFGATHYSLVRMTQFAIGGILSSSTFPLRMIAYVGLFLAAIDCFYFLWALSAGPAGISLVVILNLGFFSMSFAFLAIYVARITKDLTARPIFVVDEKNTFLKRSTERRLTSPPGSTTSP